jgi:hypothetical protein
MITLSLINQIDVTRSKTLEIDFTNRHLWILQPTQAKLNIGFACHILPFLFIYSLSLLKIFHRTKVKIFEFADK